MEQDGEAQASSWEDLNPAQRYSPHSHTTPHTHTHTYTCACACTHSRTHTHALTHTHACTHARKCIGSHAHAHTHRHTCTYTHTTQDRLMTTRTPRCAHAPNTRAHRSELAWPPPHGFIPEHGHYLALRLCLPLGAAVQAPGGESGTAGP